MKSITRAAVALAAIVSLVPGSALAQRKTKAEVPGEEQFRSAAGYHTAVMEHCKQINKLARGRGAFNVELAREHAAEVSRNLEAASRHQEGYSSAIGSTAETATASQKLVESKALAGVLTDSLKSGSADRKAVAATVTDLFLAEKDILTAQKAAAKSLKISMATNPRKASTTPRKPRAKKAPATEEVSSAKKPIKKQKP